MSGADVSIDVAIVEDEKVIREGYCFLINQSPEFHCTGYASAESALESFKIKAPDVVLMDVNLQGMNGIECTRIIKGGMPETLIMMFTVYENNENVFKALEAGASGYLLKQSAPEEVIAAIKDLYNGGAPMSGTIARKVVSAFNKTPLEDESFELSTREEEVLKLLSTGYRYKDIADRLFISISTVRSHIYNIYEKLHVHNRTEALNKFNNRR
jgi:DNA-binding NarL/FixJ family response regulator